MAKLAFMNGIWIEPASGTGADGSTAFNAFAVVS
jgi:hypothetical protein